ncbi:MAG: TauD/TfdA family dioxygenase [Myxococcales bacterium]|nr:TauD/TfdA family dioxygenase [Myxococcales bacterium]
MRDAPSDRPGLRSTPRPVEPGWRPLTGRIGAEAVGVDLRESLDDARLAFLRDGLDRYGVVFFRDAGLDDDGHRALAARLGEPLVHPFERAMGRTDPLHSIVDRETDVPDRAGWHTDDSYLERPPGLAVLRCVVAPSVGGDTLFCDMVGAYEGLSSRMRRLLDGLVGVHETDGRLIDYVRTHLPPDRLADVVREVGPGARHPIVRVHPRSGRRALFFEPNFMRRIEGLGPAETAFVQGLLRARVQEASGQCRFRWHAGDVAIWDERTTQHLGTADHAGERRVMKRCTVLGERPFGPAMPRSQTGHRA